MCLARILMLLVVLALACERATPLDAGASPGPQPLALNGCTNGVQDNLESDIDCGGTCERCEDGAHCRTEKDCKRLCIQGVCMTAPPPQSADLPAAAPGQLDKSEKGDKSPGVGAPGTATLRMPVEWVLDHATPYNGVDPAVGRRFWKDWRLVTTRYREDSQELRFIYANDIAWKAMVRGVRQYPNGAVFAKVGAATEPDGIFPNSIVPAGAVRVQFMVKNTARYPATDGWGYAIYPEGIRESSDVKVVVDACHACHRIASGFDHVFARPAFQSLVVGSEKTLSYEGMFESVDVAALDARERRLLESVGVKPAQYQGVRRLRMGLFAGSMNESVVPLGLYAARHKLPFLLVDTQGAYGLIAAPRVPAGDCPRAVTYFAETPPGVPAPTTTGQSTWEMCLSFDKASTSDSLLDGGKR